MRPSEWRISCRGVPKRVGIADVSAKNLDWLHHESMLTRAELGTGEPAVEGVESRAARQRALATTCRRIPYRDIVTS